MTLKSVTLLGEKNRGAHKKRFFIHCAGLNMLMITWVMIDCYQKNNSTKLVIKYKLFKLNNQVIDYREVDLVYYKVVLL